MLFIYYDCIISICIIIVFSSIIITMITSYHDLLHGPLPPCCVAVTCLMVAIYGYLDVIDDDFMYYYIMLSLTISLLTIIYY